MCVTGEKWDWVASLKTCRSAATVMAQCSEVATAAVVTLLPGTENAAASALGTSHAEK